MFINELRFDQIENTMYSYVYGDILLYKQGIAQALIEKHGNERKVIVRQEKAGDDKEWLCGAAYFFISENHVLLICADTITSDSVETYLNWLIFVQSKRYEPCAGFSLANDLDETSRWIEL